MFNGHFKYDDWLIFVHGDGKTLQGAVDRARDIQELHNVNVVVYSWPSKHPDKGAIKNFKNSYANVQKDATGFDRFLHMLEAVKLERPNTNFSIFFHSLGNYYLEQMIANDLHLDNNIVVFENLMINAAAVQNKNHHKWVEQIKFAKRIYINSNGEDFSLAGLRFFTRLKMQLGEDPGDDLAVNASYVNFSDAVGFRIPTGPSHSYYFASIPEKSLNIKNYFTQLFQSQEIDFLDPLIFNTIENDLVYSIIF
jgi:hypothetical protein